MPRLDYKTCRECGRPSIECGPLSHSRLCEDCGLLRQTVAIIELAEHYGPTFHHWRRQLAASVGYLPLDDLPAKP